MGFDLTDVLKKVLEKVDLKELAKDAILENLTPEKAGEIIDKAAAAGAAKAKELFAAEYAKLKG